MKSLFFSRIDPNQINKFINNERIDRSYNYYKVVYSKDNVQL